MSEVLCTAEFIEVDVTYRAAVEFDYLMNVVTFDHRTLRCKFSNLQTYNTIVTITVLNHLLDRDDCNSSSNEPAHYRCLSAEFLGDFQGSHLQKPELLSWWVS